MLKDLHFEASPDLHGYVKTNRKATAQVPLVTDLGDPLLAHWQFGLGKVTAFTSDCKSRWAAMWITTWPRYGQFWAQVLCETARKPQSQFMDIRLAEANGEANIEVDILEDASSFKNDAVVTANVYYVAAGSLASNMKQVHQLDLQQVGPGNYQASFKPNDPGVYLVRARSGSQLVSAGLVHSISGETATGQVNDKLLDRVCKLTGGQLLSADTSTLLTISRSHSYFLDLTPFLLKLLILLFLIDVGIRRWENILGMFAMIRGEK
jgi:Ca-activated chloride channel family protein